MLREYVIKLQSHQQMACQAVTQQEWPVLHSVGIGSTLTNVRRLMPPRREEVRADKLHLPKHHF